MMCFYIKLISMPSAITKLIRADLPKHANVSSIYAFINIH